jgi:hypothetical protein
LTVDTEAVLTFDTEAVLTFDTEAFLEPVSRTESAHPEVKAINVMAKTIFTQEDKATLYIRRIALCFDHFRTKIKPKITFKTANSRLIAQI